MGRITTGGRPPPPCHGHLEHLSKVAVYFELVFHAPLPDFQIALTAGEPAGRADYTYDTMPDGHGTEFITGTNAMQSYRR